MRNKKLILGVVLVLVAAAAVFFAVRASRIVSVSYYDGTTEVKASFNNMNETVTFSHEAVGKVTLPRAISASGARYANADESIVFWEHQGEAIIIKDDTTVFQGPIKNSLTGPTWIWEQTMMNDDSVVVPRETGAFTLKFFSDGRVSGTTDCNNFSGSYETGNNGAISFIEFASTLMFCEGSQENEFVTAVSNSDHYLMDDSGNLVLLIRFDSGEVRFRRQ